jgi:hypothetical protein
MKQNKPLDKTEQTIKDLKDELERMDARFEELKTKNSRMVNK